MNRKVVSLILGTVFILLLSGIAAAQRPVAQRGPLAVQVNAGSGFSFQGYLELLEDGSPVNDTCRFTFRLFDRAAGGNQVGSAQEVRDVSVVEGAFDVVLNANDQLGDGVFNGQARWLEITVDCGDGETTLNPRQELLAVPYAFSLRPGANISGALSSQAMLDIHQAAPSGPDTYVLRVRSSNPQIALVNAVNVGDDVFFDYTWKLGTPPDAASQQENASFSISSEGPVPSNADTRLLIRIDGNVGIGTTSPSYRMTVRDSDHQIGIVDRNTGKEWTFTTSDGSGNFPDRFAIAEDGGPRRLVIAAGGNVGIGDVNPDNRLSVRDFDHQIALVDQNDEKRWTMSTIDPSLFSEGGIGVYEDGQLNRNRLFIENGGNVGIGGITNPLSTLHVGGDIRGQSLIARDDDHQIALVDANEPDIMWTLSTVEYGQGGIGVYEDGANSQLPRLFIADGGDVGIGTLEPHSRLDVAGQARVQVLEITGGSDLAEQFDINGSAADLKPVPGMVVSIDPHRPGELVISEGAYDRTVAGVVSGAGDVNPGMLLSQADTLADGQYPVALTGRVYVWADASEQAIQPGDLLTTADLPGHAMKVTDYARAQGAIIGKAMSALDEGQGLVLVLVSLQ
jgi:hypothetical protein